MIADLNSELIFFFRFRPPIVGLVNLPCQRDESRAEIAFCFMLAKRILNLPEQTIGGLELRLEFSPAVHPHNRIRT